MSKKTPAWPREVPGEAGQVGDAGVRDDQLRVGVALDEAREVVGDRRQPAPAVDQDRNAALGGQREDRREPLVVEQERCARGWSLIPRAPRSRQRIRLLDRVLGQVEADERDQPSVRALGERERAVVRRPEAGSRSGSSMQNMKALRDPVALHDRLELLVLPAPAVDVVAEVDVRVEDLGAVRQQAAELLVVAREQLQRARSGSSTNVQSMHRPQIGSAA